VETRLRRRMPAVNFRFYQDPTSPSATLHLSLSRPYAKCVNLD